MPLGKLSVARVHNYYRFSGGEDQTLAAETALLRDHGHRVEVFLRDNKEVSEAGLLARASLAANGVWSTKSRKALGAFLRERAVEIAHFHNTMPLVSPAAYYAAADAGVPVVQTLHNYRTFCPSATLFRDGEVCERCVGLRFALPAIRHSCYRGDRLATLAQAATNAVHRSIGTYSGVIDAYIAMTEFGRCKAIAGGLPADRIHVKPHFVFPAPEVGSGDGNYALYAGRLVPEKGWRTLTRAWSRSGLKMRLRLIGDGPERADVERICAENPTIEYEGPLPYADTLEALRQAAFLVFPSEWYETFGRVIIEAFACGTPVLASDIGGNAEIVSEPHDGLLFKAGDADDLAAKLVDLARRVQPSSDMRRNARHTFETRYSVEQNYARLIEIYEIARSRRKAPAQSYWEHA